MPRTKTKTLARPRVQAHKQPAADFVSLLTDSGDWLEDEERQFWLANYDQLGMLDQKELARTLIDTNKEITKETEHHTGRVAEINAKCVTRLNQILKHNKNLTPLLTADLGESQKVAAEDLLDDELLHQLEAAGEL